mgnify:CR=1 FL=1
MSCSVRGVGGESLKASPTTGARGGERPPRFAVVQSNPGRPCDGEALEASLGDHLMQTRFIVSIIALLALTACAQAAMEYRLAVTDQQLVQPPLPRPVGPMGAARARAMLGERCCDLLIDEAAAEQPGRSAGNPCDNCPQAVRGDAANPCANCPQAAGGSGCGSQSKPGCGSACRQTCGTADKRACGTGQGCGNCPKAGNSGPPAAAARPQRCCGPANPSPRSVGNVGCRPGCCGNCRGGGAAGCGCSCAAGCGAGGAGCGCRSGMACRCQVAAGCCGGDCGAACGCAAACRGAGGSPCGRQCGNPCGPRGNPCAAACGCGPCRTACGPQGECRGLPARCGCGVGGVQRGGFGAGPCGDGSAWRRGPASGGWARGPLFPVRGAGFGRGVMAPQRGWGPGRGFGMRGGGFFRPPPQGCGLGCCGGR